MLCFKISYDVLCVLIYCILGSIAKKKMHSPYSIRTEKFSTDNALDKRVYGHYECSQCPNQRWKSTSAWITSVDIAKDAQICRNCNIEAEEIAIEKLPDSQIVTETTTIQRKAHIEHGNFEEHPGYYETVWYIYGCSICRSQWKRFRQVLVHWAQQCRDCKTHVTPYEWSFLIKSTTKNKKPPKVHVQNLCEKCVAGGELCTQRKNGGYRVIQRQKKGGLKG